MWRKALLHDSLNFVLLMAALSVWSLLLGGLFGGA